MGRYRLLYYALIVFVFILVVWLLSWWNSIQSEITSLPKTGSLGDCGVVNASISNDSLSWLSDINVGSNYDRLFFKITDNVDRQVICPVTQYEVMIGKCNDDSCNYSNNLKAFFTDNKGVIRMDSYLLGLPPARYSLRFRQSYTYYAWSSPIEISIDPKESLKTTSIDFDEYFKNEIGDSFIFDSKSYLSKYEELDIPIIGTTRFDTESDTYWGDYLTRPLRILKSDPCLYPDPIPLKEEFNGMNEDKLMRLMINSPLSMVKDDRILSFNDYYWVLGHKSYLRSDQNILDMNINNFYRSISYASTDTVGPAVVFGKNKQELPFVYLKQNSIRFYTNIENTAPPVILAQNEPTRSFMLRVEKENLPITINEHIYDDVIRLDMYEGVNITEYDISYRETWYLAKGIGLIKLEAKYFDPSAFLGKDDDYPYITNCVDDPDCLTSNIRNPHLLLTLNSKTSIGEMDILVEPSIIDINSDNGVYVRSDIQYTGYVDSMDNNGVIEKMYYFTNGELFIPIDAILELNTDLLSFSLRMSLINDEIEGEERIENYAPWSNEVTLRIIR